MEGSKPISVAVTGEFLSSTRKLMDDDERDALVDFLAYHPEAGDVIVGTGGIRKLRWRLEGRGKRGGARIIYYYHDENLPLFLLQAYAKNEKANLTLAERNEYRKATAALVASAKGGAR